MKNAPTFQIGYTLIELVITVTIIAVIAAIAMPAFSSGSSKQLERAAAEFAAAMRFARTESIRTGEPHGFHEQSNNKRIQVFRLDIATNPATLVYDVYHPIDKSLYDFDVDLESLAAADLITRSSNYRGTCNQEEQVYFDTNGTPWCSEPTTVLLDFYELTFTSGMTQRVVALDAITGRVTIR